MSNPKRWNIRTEKDSLHEKNLELYKMRRKLSELVIGFFVAFIIIGLSFIILFPFIKIMPNVFNVFEDIGNPNIVWVPDRFSIITFDAAKRYIELLSGMNIFNVIGRSLFYAFSIAAIQTFMSAMAGYSFARIDFKGANLLFALVIITFVVPPQALLISQYLRFSDMGLINKPSTLYLLALFGFGVKQSLFIFIFRQFFVNVPKELEEAARVDGCGFYQTYFRIILPNAIPAIMTVMVFSFVWNYGDTYYTGFFHADGPYISSILTRIFRPDTSNVQFLSRSVDTWYAFRQFTSFTFDAIKQAALLWAIAPLLTIYFIVQRKFVQSFERSGIVG
jgi:multiple sugar transport system permease protein